MPGTRQTVQIPLPSFYTHNSASMPVHVIHGKHEGPKLLVTSTMHGDEINGIEIIRRLLGKKSLKNISGTLILVPIVNVHGFISRSRYMPDRRDLNRSFPGSTKGSMAARLANLFMNKLVKKCDCLIDIHTGAIYRENLPQIRAELTKEPGLKELARAFGAPVIVDSDLKEGSLRQAARKLGIPVLLYEAGEALRFDEVGIRAGVEGILGVMSYLQMIKRKRKKIVDSLITSSSQWTRATQSGIFRSVMPLGCQVATGDTLGFVSDPFGDHEEVITSLTDGIIIGKTKLPLVHEGEAIFHIARFRQPDQAADNIEIFNDEYNPFTDLEQSDEPPLI